MIRRFDTFGLYVTPDFLAFEPPHGTKSPWLIIKKVSGEISFDRDYKRPQGAIKKPVQGILGISELPLGKVIVVVSKRDRVGEFNGHLLWRINSVEIIPLSFRKARSSDEAEAQQKCLWMLRETLSTPYFYFSLTWDLTNSRQREWKLHRDHGSTSSAKDIFERMDHRFLWNDSLLKSFLSVGHEDEVYPFITPIIHGAAFIHKCFIKDKAITWTLISRRSRYMTGTRFFARGADSKGNVANFCETEQLVEYKGQVASYIQTRGSMPMIWEQVPDLRYKPDPTVVGTQKENEEAFYHHFKEQVFLYGQQVAVNLVDQKKAEGKLERQFCDLFRTEHNLPGLNYEAFDFHKECSKMRYDRLSLLMDRLSKYDFSFFFEPELGSKDGPQLQTGVFRTNCIDCLDRTNVVQSMLASKNLSEVLHRFKILTSPSTKELEQENAFQRIYRNAWADHANLISVQYAGTGALKTDFTRKGVRTHFGYAQDGWNACNRYVKNNFCDGDRTDGLRFFVGDLSANDVVVAVVQNRRVKDDIGVMTYLPIIFQLFLCLALFTLIFAKNFSFDNVAIFLLGIVFAILSARLMLKNNAYFVNFPMKFKRHSQS